MGHEGRIHHAASLESFRRFADPGYQADGLQRCPLDTEEACRQSWLYLEEHSQLYSRSQLKKVKGRIRAALKSFGIGAELSDAHLTAFLR